MDNNKSILVVIQDFPYPPNYGGVANIWQTIKELRRSGFTLDILCSVKNEVATEYIQEVKKTVRNVYFSQRENKLIHVMSPLPLQVISRAGLAFAAVNNSYDILLLESEYVGLVLKNKTIQYKEIVIRLHNNESKYFWQLQKSTGNLLEKAYYLSDSIKFSFYSKRLFREFKNLVFVSSDELKYFQEGLDDGSQGYRLLYLPPMVDLLHFKKQPLESAVVLFVGALFMPNNLEAIYWYLQNVHPRMRGIEGYKFVIAGSKKGNDLSGLYKATAGDNTVEIHADVPDLDVVYSKARVFVNPMLSGAGVKIKTVHSMVAGLPLVSSPIGAEGLGFENGQHYLLAQSPQEFVIALKKLLQDNALCEVLVDNSQRYIAEYFTITRLTNYLANL